MATVVLKPGRDKSLLRRHPWVFAGAIERVEGAPARGETVAIRAAAGAVLARGAYSPDSQIAVRTWTFSADDEIDAAFIRARVHTAVAARARLAARDDLTAYRLVNAESDGLPGLVADRYGDWVVCQFSAAGVERWKDEIAQALAEGDGVRGVFERSDLDVRKKEGLEPVVGLLAGEAPPERIEIREGAARFLVDVREGHKTGFYLDQRRNRRLVGEHAAGREVLNCFAYTGGFGIAASLGGAAHVTHIEASGPALETVREHVELNGIDPGAVDAVEGNVFGELRRLRSEDRSFDLIVLDPPKFADAKYQVEKACRGYKDINLQAFHLLRPGGLLFTFSCSGRVEPALFQKVVADAALDAGRDAQIVRRLEQGEDHPTLLAFPEGAYLKGLVCRG